MTSSPIIEKLKLWLIVLLVITTVYVFSYAELSTAARFGIGVGSIAFALLILFFSQSGRKIYLFSRESFAELRKVVWPTKQETLQLTLVVFIFLTVMVAMLSFFDFIIGLVIEALA